MASQGQSLSNATSMYTDTTDSLGTYITQYPYENGRRYHKYKEGSYLFPNDETELERMALQHEMFHILFDGRLHFAPLYEPEHILDVGTGVGHWAVEMADKFQNAKVEGTDLSPVQTREVPINLRFIIDDASDIWIQPTPLYSFVHTRQLAGCFHDFRTIIASAYNNIAPGGWCESHELFTKLHLATPTSPESPYSPLPDSYAPLARWIQELDDVFMSIPQPLRIANKMARWYREAGFVDVQERVFDVPVTEYPRPSAKERDLAELSQRSWQAGLNAMCMAPFTRYNQWTKNEVEVRLVDVRKALASPSEPIVQKCYVVWGRKPYPGEVSR